MLKARTLLIRTILLAAGFLAFCQGPVALAQQQAVVDFSGFWTVKFDRDPAGNALFAKIPEGAVFIDDAGGGELGVGDYGGLQLSPEALDAVRNHDFSAEFSVENTCLVPSSAYYMQAPFPMEIHQADKLTVLKMEYFDRVRLIFTDGRQIPEDAPHTKDGYSVGYWQGDELVVHTEKLSSATLMNNGFNHSDNLVMTERFKMSADGRTLWVIQLYEDPEVFTPMGARYFSFSKVDDEFVYPYECDYSFGR